MLLEKEFVLKSYHSEHMAIIISFVFLRHPKLQVFSLSPTRTTKNTIHFISVPVVYTNFTCAEHTTTNPKKKKKDCSSWFNLNNLKIAFFKKKNLDHQILPLNSDLKLLLVTLMTDSRTDINYTT